MARIEIPQRLKALLDESDLQAPLRTLADRVGEVLTDNKLPFFPDYTDHGIDHINRVLKSEVELVPEDVWAKSKSDSPSRLLCDADAAVIVGSTLLHDIAMHLYPVGFLELISQETRFLPLAWFRGSNDGHLADRSWHDLWQDYVRESRRFNDRTLVNIIGPESVRESWKFHDLPKDVGQWERNHCLVIGEFIRRHHARMAHEIAIYGFPGLPVGSGEGQFPALGTEKGHPLRSLADLIGITARSHGMSLRVCKAYLDQAYPGTPRPMGTAVLFPMALLRVADYFQIDRQRAPAVLLQLRNPQSPISVQEWEKHQAVLSITPATDPRGKQVTVSRDLGLNLYLQLHDLLAGLQAEMDHSTAVLDETYGVRSDLGLDRLSLAVRRVGSNLDNAGFRDSLPYVPERTGFATDPNLLTLLVEPLYGREPAVGVRELIQNAVDAVEELRIWCEVHGAGTDSLDLPDQESDVLIEFVQRDNDTWVLRAQDKGIGMTSETIQKYFLRAGATFRLSPDWAKEFLDDEGRPRVVRAGRFGIGVFAVFLLGPTFRMWTRHVSAPKSTGYMIEASVTSHLIEIRRNTSLPIGTTIEVDLTSSSVYTLRLEEQYPGYSTDWFCWDWPRVSRRIRRGEETKELAQSNSYPTPGGNPSHEWSVIHPPGFDAVHWTFASPLKPKLVCNGLSIEAPRYLSSTDFEWPPELEFDRPRISVIDRFGNLPLTTQRYGLSDKLPFIDELARDVTMSFVAHALICGPISRVASHSSDGYLSRHPLLNYYRSPALLTIIPNGLARWCTTLQEFVPADPWLYSLLQATSCLAYGALYSTESQIHWDLKGSFAPPIQEALAADHAVLIWDQVFKTSQGVDMLTELGQVGVGALGPATGVRLVASSNYESETEVPRSRWLTLSRLQDSEKRRKGSVLWREMTSPNNRASRYELQTGTIEPSLRLDALISKLEEASGTFTVPYRVDDMCLFVAEISTKSTGKMPESLIASIWNECLGPRAIPFEPERRRELIEQGRRHPELKRHIEAWEGMKRSGSEYAGSARPESSPGY